MHGKRVPGEKAKDLRATFQEADLGAGDDRCAVPGGERGEPEVPVEARLVRRVDARAIVRVLRFEAKEIGRPVLVIVGALKLDLVAVRRHVGEKAVLVGDAERLKQGDGTERHREAGQEEQHEQHRRDVGDTAEQDSGECDAKRADELARVTAWAGGRACACNGGRRFDGGGFVGEGVLGVWGEAGAPALGEEAEQGAVVQQKNPEKEDEVVEKRIVGRGDDADLPHRDDDETGDAPAPRKEGEKDEDEFHPQRQRGRKAVKGEREVLEVPADPGGQRAVLVVLVHRGEVAPGRVAGGELDDAGLKVDPEPLPEQKEKGRARGQRAGAPARPQTAGRDKDGEEAGLKQHAVRLVLAEVLRDRDPAQEAEPAYPERKARRQVKGDQYRGQQPHPHQGDECVVRAVPPEHGGGKPEALLPERAQRLEVARRRQDARRAAHAEHLKDQREEGRKVHQAEAAQKEPARKKAVARTVVPVEKEVELVQRLGHAGLDGRGARRVVAGRCRAAVHDEESSARL